MIQMGQQLVISSNPTTQCFLAHNQIIIGLDWFAIFLPCHTWFGLALAWTVELQCVALNDAVRLGLSLNCWLGENVQVDRCPIVAGRVECVTHVVPGVITVDIVKD